MRLVPKNKWWQLRFTPINMNLKLPGSETPWRKKEIQRVVDPPWRMKTSMGTRDNSRWRKEWYKPWSKNNSWSWGMMYMIWWNKCTKQGSWFSLERIDYDMTYSIDQYMSSIEPPVQNEEGRWYSTSGGVTIENYIWVRQGMTWWIALWWIETLPRVK